MSEKDPIDQILKKAADVEREINAPPQPLPPALAKKLEQRFPKRYPVPAPEPELALVNERQLRVIILKAISETPMDGITLIAQLEKRHIKLISNIEARLIKFSGNRGTETIAAFREGIAKSSTKASREVGKIGNAAIYGILRKMERSGLLEGEWRDVSEKMEKTYRVTDLGTTFLNKHAGEVVSMGHLLSGEWAIEPR